MSALAPKISHLRNVLSTVERDFAPAVFASSFGAEDMVLTHLIALEYRSIEIVTLDTGRLPEETYALMQRVAEHYRRKIRVFYPNTADLENYVRQNGINGFYDSVAQRKACCHVRKVEPLQRALAGKRAWITGLRRAQAVTRQNVEEVELENDSGRYKFNPLIDWPEEDVWAFLRTHEVPYNALHERGYPSIGCAPCTRAVGPREDLRAGRWWWEAAEQKECGLHVGEHDGHVAVT
jgi:phosphoadenosine phosphosulfate reductase